MPKGLWMPLDVMCLEGVLSPARIVEGAFDLAGFSGDILVEVSR
jgi:hypothetical protein